MPPVSRAPGMVLNGMHLRLKGVAVKLLHAGAQLTARDFQRLRVEAMRARDSRAGWRR